MPLRGATANENPPSVVRRPPSFTGQGDTMMKAVGLRRYLPISHEESFLDVEVEKPVPRPRDLLVRVKAVSVNPVDAKTRGRGGDKVEAEPRILGWDAAGVVEAVGDEVTLFGVGDAVYYAGSIDRPGANATYQAVDERIVGRKPETLSWREAAAMPLTTLTAWEALFDRLQVQAGREAGARRALLLINGAGGVGSVALQLARQLTDLTVVATASRPESKSWCQRLGAHFVVDHRQSIATQLAELEIENVDFILCCYSPVPYMQAMAAVIKPQGKICNIVSAGEPLPVDILMGKSVAWLWELMYTRPLYQTADMVRQHEILNEVARLLDEGVLQHTMTEYGGVLNAANLRSAHARLESGGMIGKLVLDGIMG
jgi:NADPH:quinone reductase